MKRVLSFVLSLILLCTLVPYASAANNEALTSANKLYELDLFVGTGIDKDGNPIFALDRVPTRNEAITMLVRLLGKGAEAKKQNWDIPFTDVAKWARPYVGYAYATGLTSGTSKTTFSGDSPASATQYISFVLRALGYKSGEDFKWNRAWELSDKIGLSNNQYRAATKFTRGDVAILSYNALAQKSKNSNVTLVQSLASHSAVKKGPTLSNLLEIYGEIDHSTEHSVLPTRITIACDDAFIRPGEEIVLTANVSPSDATTSDLIWETDRPECISVNNGVVRMFAAGTGSAKITATSPNGVSGYTYVFLQRSNKKEDVKDAAGLRSYLQTKYTHLDTPVGNLILSLTMNISQKYPDEPLFASISVDFHGEEFAPNPNSIGIPQKVTPLNFTGVGYSRDDEKAAYKMLQKLQQEIYQDIIDCFPNAQARGDITEKGYHYPSIHVGYWRKTTLSWNNYNGEFQWVPSIDTFKLIEE